MNIYTKEGWLDVPAILSQNQPFNYITGARGTGKTYGALKYAVEHKQKFFFLRRTTTEMEMVTSMAELNPWNALNKDHGWHYDFFSEGKDVWSICPFIDDETGKRKKAGESIGIAMSLYAISKIRGFSAEDITMIIYDEFIPENHVRALKDEGAAWANAIETINRNRELKGEPPCTVLAMSNANKLDNEIYLFLNLVAKVVSMQRKGQEFSVMQDKAMTLTNIMRSPISQRKETTALYRHTRGTAFAGMALANEYIGEFDREDNSSKPLVEYKPICTVGEVTLYRHKSRKEYYCTTFRTGSPRVYTAGERDLARWRRDFPDVRYWYLDHRITFESRVCEVLIERYLTK